MNGFLSDRTFIPACQVLLPEAVRRHRIEKETL